MRRSVDVKVLGPLEATANGRSFAPSAGKPRKLLALLALNCGRAVSVPELVDELWGTDPPRTAHTTLQTYVMQLRRSITTAAERRGASVLAHQSGSYRLAVDPDAVDVGRFRRFADSGQRAFAMGELELAARLLGDALAQWRGPALVDVEHGMPLALEVTRLAEDRLAVIETRAEAELAMGRHRVLVGELAMLNAQHAMNENMCGLYMLALYRAGRQWQALEAYRALRLTLVGELGVEPSPRLQRLHRAILHADPTLDDPRPDRLLSMLAHGEVRVPALARGA